MVLDETITITKTYVNTAGYLKGVDITLALSDGSREHTSTQAFSIKNLLLHEGELSWEEPAVLNIVNSKEFSFFRQICLQEIDIVWKGYTETQTSILYT